MVNNIKQRAADAGITLNVIDGKGDPNLQVTQVLDAVTKQPHALLINPVDAKLLVAGVKRANEANIPVFIMENPPPEGEYLSFVDFDNEAGGAMGADALAAMIGEEGVVLETRGSTGSEQAELRHKGFNDRIKEKYPNIEVKSLNTEWVADNAYKMVLDAFTQNPDIKGVFSHNDEMVRGVVSALRQIGKLTQPGGRGPCGPGRTGWHAACLAAHSRGHPGRQRRAKPFAMGNAIFDAIIAHFEGGTVPEKARTQPVLITKDNVDGPRPLGQRQELTSSGQPRLPAEAGDSHIEAVVPSGESSCTDTNAKLAGGVPGPRTPTKPRKPGTFPARSPGKHTPITRQTPKTELRRGPNDRDLQVEDRPIEALGSHARRPPSDRQITEIAGSIKGFGWNNPILMDGV
jgi:ribose transport system substrate-binding protein